MISVLRTITEVRRNGSEVGIYTYYTEAESIKAFISQEANSVNGVPFLENELGFIVRNYPDVIFALNNKGELVIQHNDDKSFSINSNGELIFEVEI